MKTKSSIFLNSTPRWKSFGLRQSSLALLFLLVIFAVNTAAIAAGQVKLAWDASVTPGGVAGYTLYAHTNSMASGTNLSAALVKVQTTNLTVNVQFTNAQPRWFFVATAIGKDGLESPPSNELIVQSPAAPGNLRTLAVQYIPTITGTNWTDVGFFRLQIGP